MCMNRPIPGSPFHTATAAATTAIDFPPGVPREEVWVDDEPRPFRFPLHERAFNFAVSRAEWVHRRAKRLARIFRVALRQLYRTRFGYIVIWLNAVLWGLYAATLILGIK